MVLLPTLIYFQSQWGTVQQERLHGWSVQGAGHVGARHDQREGLRGLHGLGEQQPGPAQRQDEGEAGEVTQWTDMATVLQLQD